MRKYISLLFLTAIIMSIAILVIPANAVISRTGGGGGGSIVVGASVLADCNSANWAGVVYSDENNQSNSWSPIQWASENIYVQNLSLTYTSGSNPNVIGIWIALSPYKVGIGPGNSTPSQIGSNFIQAGFDFLVYSNDTIDVLYFIQGYVNGRLYTYGENFVPSGSYQSLYVYMSYLGNEEVYIEFEVLYTNGTSWIEAFYAYWAWGNQPPYTAMTIVEAPLNPSTGKLYELPIVNGGMITFAFAYEYNGQTYIGPGQSAPGTTLWAYVFNLDETYPNNSAQVEILVGWAYENQGWDYLYQFYYPNLNEYTDGL